MNASIVLSFRDGKRPWMADVWFEQTSKDCLKAKPGAVHALPRALEKCGDLDGWRLNHSAGLFAGRALSSRELRERGNNKRGTGKRRIDEI
jgi:hypothetical protein